MAELSRNQVDCLGERLRKGSPTDADLQVLDEYRRSFAEAILHTVNVLREQLGLLPTSRPAKSTVSIVDKLRRESIRLSQMQDIGGCRVVVPDIAAQESVMRSLRALFAVCNTADRRKKPSHGYRAVHAIVEVDGKLVEIQVRTEIEHAWAELSEKLSDLVSSDIKYGGGPPEIRERLSHLSVLVEAYEDLEQKMGDESQVPVTRHGGMREMRDLLFEIITIVKKEYQK